MGRQRVRLNPQEHLHGLDQVPGRNEEQEARGGSGPDHPDGPENCRRLPRLDQDQRFVSHFLRSTNPLF